MEIVNNVILLVLLVILVMDLINVSHVNKMQTTTIMAYALVRMAIIWKLMDPEIVLLVIQPARLVQTQPQIVLAAMIIKFLVILKYQMNKLVIV